jgi:hypothetical protein
MSPAYILSGWPHLSRNKYLPNVELTKYSSKMPAFTLYGSRGSTNTDRVRLTLAEAGFTDYEFVLLNLQKGEQKVGGQFLLKLKISSRSSNICSPACNVRF